MSDMKKTLLIMQAALLALGACTNDVDEVFDKPASQRLNERMLECQRLLAAPQHGWSFVYYPSPTRQFGGSAYMAKFSPDGNVTVTGDVASELHKDVSEVITSHYSIKSSSSVVLTFDTYNDYIHHWSDPDPYGGNAFEGDFEFEYVSGDESRMLFRGIKTGNEIIFTALGEDIVEAARKVVGMREEIAGQLFSTYEWSDGARRDTLYDNGAYNVLTHYLTSDTEGEYETLPYAFTETGISFYEPVTIGGVTAQKFDYAGGRLVAADGVDEAGAKKEVSLTGAQCENFVHYDDIIGTYSMPCIIVTSQGTQQGNARVTLSEKERLKTFSLDGILQGYPIELAYNKGDCSLSLTTQYLGELAGEYLYLCPWDTELGYLTWSSGVGMTLRHNEGEGVSFTFEDNGVWGGNIVSGLLFYLFTGPPSSDTTDGAVARLYGLTKLTKIN